jgi:nucleotide-binding universal stress UspA family protein
MLTISVYTNGHPATWPAIQYAAHLAASTSRSLRLIAVDERSAGHAGAIPLPSMLEKAQTLCEEFHLALESEIERGQAEEVIPQKVNQAPQGLHVLGPLGRPPLRRLIWGRSFRHIMAKAVGPLLYVPRFLWPPREILICVGGIGYEVTAEKLGLDLAQHLQANVTLLTVIPPADLDYPLVHEIQEHERDLWETNTPLGRALRRGLEQAAARGVQATVHVRHGEVIEQILSEIRERQSQLVCMGSPFSSHSLRHYYMPNVTAEIAESGIVPVLTARYRG